MATVIKLRLESKDLMDFKVIGKHNFFPKLEGSIIINELPNSPPAETQTGGAQAGPSDTANKTVVRPNPPLICQFRYVDLSVLEMLSVSSAQFLATSISFQIHPECQQQLTYFITNLTQEAQDYRFLYEDIHTGATYLLQFEQLMWGGVKQQSVAGGVGGSQSLQTGAPGGVVGAPAAGKIDTVKLVRLGLVEDEKVGLEVGRRKVEGLQRKMTEITDLWEKEMAAIEQAKKDLKTLKSREEALVREVNDMNGRINLAKTALSEYLKVEDAVREKTQERDKLVKVMNNLSKEAPTKKKEMNDSLSNKFLALRADMTSEYNQKLLAHIEEERKLRISHTAAKQKEATHASIRRHLSDCSI